MPGCRPNHPKAPPTSSGDPPHHPCAATSIDIHRIWKVDELFRLKGAFFSLSSPRLCENGPTPACRSGVAGGDSLSGDGRYSDKTAAAPNGRGRDQSEAIQPFLLWNHLQTGISKMMNHFQAQNGQNRPEIAILRRFPSKNYIPNPLQRLKIAKTIILGPFF